jgi:hypothetical protein
MQFPWLQIVVFWLSFFASFADPSQASIPQSHLYTQLADTAAAVWYCSPLLTPPHPPYFLAARHTHPPNPLRPPWSPRVRHAQDFGVKNPHLALSSPSGALSSPSGAPRAACPHHAIMVLCWSWQCIACGCLLISALEGGAKLAT